MTLFCKFLLKSRFLHTTLTSMILCPIIFRNWIGNLPRKNFDLFLWGWRFLKRASSRKSRLKLGWSGRILPCPFSLLLYCGLCSGYVILIWPWFWQSSESETREHWGMSEQGLVASCEAKESFMKHVCDKLGVRSLTSVKPLSYYGIKCSSICSLVLFHLESCSNLRELRSRACAWWGSDFVPDRVHKHAPTVFTWWLSKNEGVGWSFRFIFCQCSNDDGLWEWES